MSIFKATRGSQYSSHGVSPSLLRILAKAIPIPKPQIRELAEQVLDSWLAVMERVRRPRKEEETESPSMWAYGHKLYDETTLTGLQVKPLGSKHPVAITISAKLWKPAAGRTYAVGGEMRHRKVDKRSLPFALVVKFSPIVAPSEYKANRPAAVREIYSILIHEFTHAIDFMPPEFGGSSQFSEKNDALAYHNTPTEVRAFQQQILDEVEDYLEAYVAKDRDTWGLKDNPTSLLKSALEKSFTWQRIESTLTPANRRFILRNVGQRAIALFDELVEKYGEA